MSHIPCACEQYINIVFTRKVYLETTGSIFKNTLQISMGRSSRIFRILTNEINVENRFMKASDKILNSYWSAQIEELV